MPNRAAALARCACATFLILVAPAPQAAAGDPWKITPLLLEGDTVPGAGTVTHFDDVQVNDRGDWSTIVRATGAPNSNALVRNGVKVYAGGDIVGGHVVDRIPTHQLTNAGRLVHDAKLADLSSPNDFGLFFDDVAIHVGGEAPAPELDLWSGSVYRWFIEPHWNESGRIIYPARLELPDPDEVRTAIVLARVDSAGGLLGESTVFKEGESLPNSDLRAVGFLGARVNASGETLVIVDTNAGVLHLVVYLGDEPIATLEGPSLVPGETWDDIALGLALNDAGDHVWAGTSSKSGSMIVKNGAPFVTVGDELPALGLPLTIPTLGAFDLDRGGRLLWRGAWWEGQTIDGWFLDHELLVREGDEVPGIGVIDELYGTEAAADLSDDGRFAIFEMLFDDGRFGLLLASPAGAVEAMADCGGNAGVLTHTAGIAEGGQTLTFELSGGQSGAGLALLHASTAPIVGWPGCGVPVPGVGELLIDIGPTNPVASFSTPWTGSPVALDVPLPAGVELIGQHVYLQGHFFDPTFVAQPQRLSGGVEVIIGDGIH